MKCVIAYLHLTSVQELRRVRNKTASPITLHTSDDVVGAAGDALRDDTETVVLHRSRAADASKETLLDSLTKLDNRNTIRGL